MRLPQILAETDVAVSSRTSSGIADALAAPYAAAAQGIGVLGRAVSGALLTYGDIAQKAEDAKREQQVKIDVERVEASVERRISDLTSSLDQTVTDSDEWMRLWAEGIRDIRGTAAQEFKYPETATRLEARWPDVEKREYAKAIARRDALYTRERLTDVEITLDELLQLASREAFTPEGEANAARFYQKGLSTLAAALPILGTSGTKRAFDFRNELIAQRAEAHVDSDAESFLADAESSPLYRQLDPAKRQSILRRADGIVQQRKKDAAAEMNQWFARIEKDAEEERKAQVLDLFAEARDGRLTLARLETRRAMRMVVKEEYEQLREHLERPKTLPSDPAVASRILLDVESIRPTTTDEDITRLHDRYAKGLPGLSLADATRAKQQLRQTTLALQDRTKADLTRNHEQAEQELRAALQIRPGLIASKLGDDPADRIHAVLLPELRRRSLLFGGQEQPLIVANELAQRARTALGSAAALKDQEIRALYPTPEALERAWRSGVISEAEFTLRRRQYQEALKTPPGAPSAPSPTPRIPRK